MYIGSTMQVAGMMGGIASLVVDKASGWHTGLIAIIALACMGMLLSGRYRLVERVCIAMVVLFTFFTILALVSLQFTENFAISAGDIGSGLTFVLPEDFAIAFGAFAIIGVGTSELIYYPYWCIEKGYARNTGKNDNTIGWLDRALGWLNVMRWDAWVSCAIILVQPSPFICSERQRSMGPARKSPSTTSSRTSPRCTRARLVSSVKPSLVWVVSACCSRRCSRRQPRTPVCSRMGRLFLNSKNTKMKTSGITWSRWGPWYYLFWPSSFIGHLANRSRWFSWEPSRRERFCRFWHSPRFFSLHPSGP